MSTTTPPRSPSTPFSTGAAQSPPPRRTGPLRTFLWWTGGDQGYRFKRGAIWGPELGVGCDRNELEERVGWESNFDYLANDVASSTPQQTNLIINTGRIHVSLDLGKKMKSCKNWTKDKVCVVCGKNRNCTQVCVFCCHHQPNKILEQFCIVFYMD